MCMLKQACGRFHFLGLFRSAGYTVDTQGDYGKFDFGDVALVSLHMNLLANFTESIFLKTSSYLWTMLLLGINHGGISVLGDPAEIGPRGTST